MFKKNRRIIIIYFGILTILVILLVVYKIAFQTRTEPEYLGLKTYPRASFVQTVTDPQEPELIKTILETEDNVPEVSGWYLKNYSDSGWQMDVPPADMDVNNIQYIRLRKGDELLNVSLIRNDDGKTSIIMESSSQDLQQEGEEEEEDVISN